MIHILIPTTKERRIRLNECLEAIRSNTEGEYLITVFENSCGGCVEPSRKMVATLKDDELVCILNDDMIPQPKWLSYLLKKHQESGGLVYPDDGLRDGKLATTWLCTAKYLSDNYSGDYKHSFADQEMTERAKARNELHYVPESKIIHKHFTKQNDLYDETYKLQTLTISKDEQQYHQRKLN